MEEVVHDGLSLVRKAISTNDISSEAVNLIEQSLRTGTTSRYKTHLCNFTLFCKQRGEDPINATEETGINFLANYFQTGVGYSSVNTARSALSAVMKTRSGTSFGKLPLVTRLLKGMFNVRLHFHGTL